MRIAEELENEEKRNTKVLHKKNNMSWNCEK